MYEAIWLALMPIGMIMLAAGWPDKVLPSERGTPVEEAKSKQSLTAVGCIGFVLMVFGFIAALTMIARF